MTGPFRTWLQATVNRFPGLRPVLLAAWALILRPVVRIAFMPFRVDQGRGNAAEDPELVGTTTVYNEAAERYFAEYADPQFLLDKPFSEPRLFPSYLVNAGTLLVGSRLRPGRYRGRFRGRIVLAVAPPEPLRMPNDLHRRLRERTCSRQAGVRARSAYELVARPTVSCVRRTYPATGRCKLRSHPRLRRLSSRAQPTGNPGGNAPGADG